MDEADTHSTRASRVGVLGLVVIAAAAWFGGAMATAVYHALSYRPAPPSQTTTVVRGTSSVVTSIRKLATLQTTSYHIERVIDLRDRQSHLFGLVETEDALLLVAAGDVIAGVDLSSMRDGDVTVDVGARTVQVLLPPATVLSATLDNQHTYVHTRATGALAERAETLETRARQEAERTLREAALSAGILPRAEQGAIETIRTLVGALGFDHVDVRFREE